MPSELHEALLLLLRDLPTLAPLLLRDSLHVDLPRFTEARIESGDLTEVRPAEYRADLVVSLLDREPVHAIVVEAQLSRDPRKRFAWPVYVTNLRARLLDDARGGMYCDLVFDLLSEAAQTELRAMDPAKYEYRTAFAKRYFGQGRAEGELRGRAAMLEHLLKRRFGPLTAETSERLSTASIDELDAIGERLLSAQSLEDALGPR